MTPVLRSWEENPDRPVLHGPEEVFGAREALETVYRLARALAEHGCGPGRAVALFGPVSPRMFLVAHAVQLAGGAQAEIPPGLDGPAQAQLVRECAPALTVADPGAVGSATLRALMADRCLFTLDRSEEGQDLFALCRSYSALPLPSRIQAGTPARISMTGGSTGRSKPVVRSFGAAPARAAGVLGGILSRGEGAPHVLVADRLTGLMKTSGDLVSAAGGAVTALPDYDPGRILTAVADHGITHMVVPAHALRRLVEHPGTAHADLSGLEGIVCGGGSVNPALLERALDRFGPILHLTYGQTEAGNIAWLGPGDYADRDPAVLRSCGHPSPGVDVRVRGPRDEARGPGERGRVWVRTPLMMDGYLGRPEATARVMREGWLDTEDVGFLDGEGRLTLLGRASDAISVGGSEVFSSEVDAVLQGHPAVADSAAFDTAGQNGRTELHAAVVTRDGTAVGEEELRSLVRSQLGRDHAPSMVLFVPRIPYTFAHELCRATLRDWHRHGVPAPVAQTPM